MSASDYATKLTLALLIVLALVGCEQKATIDSLAPLKTNPSQKTAKPGASIRLKSSSPLYITPYELVHSDILLEASGASGQLTIHFSPSQGLALKNTDSPQLIKVDNAGAIKIPVSLQTTNVGRYYLNMHITLDNSGSISVRNLAVIVQAGASLEKDIKLQKTTGENIIKLPAQEMISTE